MKEAEEQLAMYDNNNESVDVGVVTKHKNAIVAIANRNGMPLLIFPHTSCTLFFPITCTPLPLLRSVSKGSTSSAEKNQVHLYNNCQGQTQDARQTSSGTSGLGPGPRSSVLGPRFSVLGPWPIVHPQTPPNTPRAHRRLPSTPVAVAVHPMHPRHPLLVVAARAMTPPTAWS